MRLALGVKELLYTPIQHILATITNIIKLNTKFI